jgi:hypothetical protein
VADQPWQAQPDFAVEEPHQKFSQIHRPDSILI